MIGPFQGEYDWLSNFYPCRIYIAALVFPSVEHAYQSCKTLDVEEKEWFTNPVLTPGQAKRLGGRVTLRSHWDNLKLFMMRPLIAQKFEDLTLMQKLIDTNNEELVEINTWGDTFWGVCNGVGSNNLGRLLMETRSIILANTP